MPVTVYRDFLTASWRKAVHTGRRGRQVSKAGHAVGKGRPRGASGSLRLGLTDTIFPSPTSAECQVLNKEGM